ncbi:hypothetical protein F5X98DRAFT_380641 [Xylaria grammica]|nr:hypothetical protein F5X98DRAFT_380641 [Xylaria grammica]
MVNSFSPTPEELLGYSVKLGVWTNWSRGPVFGATLTLDRQRGSLLISFTAFFVTIVAVRFWRLACSILHRKLSVAERRDALYYQRQAIFRNSASAESALWSLIRVTWAWRHLSQTRSLYRTLPSIVFAAIILTAFSFASGFSSSISTAIGDEVLLDGTHCGYLDQFTLTPEEAFQFSTSWEANLIANAASYAEQAYSPNNIGIFSSAIFVRRQLDTVSFNFEAPCPFQEHLCRSNSSNLLLDSGYVDTGYQLGVNLRPDQSILFRQVVQCAPLVTDGHKTPTDYYGLSNYTSYNYGRVISLLSPEDDPNHTLTIKNIEFQYVPPGSRVAPSGYLLNVLKSFTYHGVTLHGDFIPEPGLQRSGADIYLFFLSGNGVGSSIPLHDPWYRFNAKSNAALGPFNTNEPRPAYRPSEEASPLGCTYQVQVCKGASAKVESCGPLGSFNDAWIDAAHLFGIDTADFTGSRYSSLGEIMSAYAANEDASRFLWFLQAISNNPTDLGLIVKKLGSQSLASHKSLDKNIQGPLPDDQWKLDVTYWWNISLSALQATFINTACGSNNPDVSRLQTNATNPGQRSICDNQKILSTQYISMSIFGLYFTYITGFLITILSLAIDPILDYAQRRWKYREYENLEWISNETLQLQRLAYDESGQGEWSKCTDYVPVTAPDEKLGILNLADPEHPRLRQPKPPRSSKKIPRVPWLTVVLGRNNEGIDEGPGGGADDADFSTTSTYHSNSPT